MKKIQMVDLNSQYQKIKTEIDTALQAVIDTSAFINGPEVAGFTSDLKAYTGSAYVIPCANGTDALQIAMMALELKEGDEVIVPAFTYVATAEVIALLKLTPVLVDVNPDDFTIDPDKIEEAITPKTKAIVPVHLFGQCANMERIMEIAARHQLYIIEDTAQAIGAICTFSDGRKLQAGTIGTIGTTSFFPSKNLGCMGDGGAIFTQDEALYKKIKMIANHGQSIQYLHDAVGVNSRLDSLQAAILRVKLNHLDTYTKARQQAAHTYDIAFANQAHITIPARAPWSTHVFHQYTLKLSGVNRDQVRKLLADKEIPSMVYYPIPLHLQKAYQSDRFPAGKFPVTEHLCANVLSLPMNTELDEDQLAYICTNLLKICTLN